MNKSFRSFFLATSIVVLTVLTGCAGTGGIQGRANLPVSIDGRAGNIVIGGQGSNGSGQVYQQPQPQQQVALQQQCPQGQQLWNMSDGSRRCLGAQGQAQQASTIANQQVVIINNNQSGSPDWCGDTCRRETRAPVIPAAPCRMVNVLVRDQYGRQFYQQQRDCR